MTLPPPKSYRLDCQHVIWLRTPPVKGDQLWCTKCRRYEPLFLASVESGEIYDPTGEFFAKRIGGKLVGTCLYKDCGHTHETRGTYETLSKAMHTHYMRSHTRWTVKTGKVARQSRTPPGSTPPF